MASLEVAKFANGEIAADREVFEVCAVGEARFCKQLAQAVGWYCGDEIRIFTRHSKEIGVTQSLP